MKIKMLSTACGPTGTYERGGVYDVPDVQARVYVAGGYAVAIDAPAVPAVKAEERAVAPDAPEVREDIVPSVPTVTRRKTNL